MRCNLPTASFEATNKEAHERGEPPLREPAQRGCRSRTAARPEGDREAESRDVGRTARRTWRSPNQNRLPRGSIARLRVNPDRRAAKTLEEVIQFIGESKEKRETLKYGTDGVVVKVDSVADQKRLGFVANNPRWGDRLQVPRRARPRRRSGHPHLRRRMGTLTPVRRPRPCSSAGTTSSAPRSTTSTRCAGSTYAKGSRHHPARGRRDPEVVRVEAARRGGEEYPEFDMPASARSAAGT